MKLNLKYRFALCQLALLAGCLPVCGEDVDISKLPPPAATQVNFARDIRPIFENNCLRCHGPEKSKSRFRIDNRESALKGGENGVDILPGNGAKSPLIHYVARLVPDMEMPPVDKGEPLKPDQIAVLRAWIDQGAAWGPATISNNVDFSFSPVLGGTSVTGDSQKFREEAWQKEGFNGGVENFELFDQVNPNTKLLANGHFLVDDYQINVAVDRNDVGFVHTGWQEYRKYFDNVGGYDPATTPAFAAFGQNLYLDVGKAWIDLGLTLPDLPRMTLGYEYNYRQGEEATLEWGALGKTPATARNIAPAGQNLNEQVHVIKFDLDDDISGTTIEERFRGEFYKLNTASANVVSGQGQQELNDGTTYFQGANTLRVEKKFNDWFFGSAGYLFSKLDADSSFTLDAPVLLQQTSAPDITLERESNVGNVNGLFGPFAGLVLSMGAQLELTHQNSFGAGAFDPEIPFSTPSNSVLPFLLSSLYNESSARENVSLRYSKIPHTGLYAEARFEQQNVGQDDQFAAAQDILNKAVFLQHTDFSSRISEVRTGFDTSPWQKISFNAYFRRYQNDSQYNGEPLVQPIPTGYPTFLLDRQIITDEAAAKLVLHLSPIFKTSLSYKYQDDDYGVTTRPFTSFGNVITPGGQLVAGKDHANVYSLNATLTPIRRLFLTGTFSYQTSSLITAPDVTGGVAPYTGNVYTALVNATLVLNQTTDIFAGAGFSEADYAQNNLAASLPLGIEYHEHSVQVGISRKFGKNISAKLQYRLDHYDEPSDGGASNFRAESVFGVVTFKCW